MGTIDHLNLQGQKVIQVRSSQHAELLLGLLFDPEDGGDMCLRNIV
jgi:hypothetical protein